MNIKLADAKLSTLIDALQTVLEKQGDKEVNVNDGHGDCMEVGMIIVRSIGIELYPDHDKLFPNRKR